MDNQKAGRSRIFWTDVMDKIYIALLVEHAQNGCMEGPSYRKSTWHDMMVRFNAKTHMNIEIDQLRNRLKFYRHEFRIVKELKSCPGFHWDDKKQVMIADDASWNQYFAKKPTARYYRNRSVALFKDLEIIFGSLAVASNASSSTHDLDVGEEDIIEGVGRTEGSEESKLLMEAKSTPDEPAPATNAINLVATQMNEYPIVRDNHKRRRSAASTMVHADKGNHCDRVEPMVTIAKAPETDIRATGILCSDKFKRLDECMAELNAIDGLDDELYVKALFILRDEYNRCVFLNTSGRRRMVWLRAVTRDVDV